MASDCTVTLRWEGGAPPEEHVLPLVGGGRLDWAAVEEAFQADVVELLGQGEPCVFSEGEHKGLTHLTFEAGTTQLVFVTKKGPGAAPSADVAASAGGWGAVAEEVVGRAFKRLKPATPSHIAVSSVGSTAWRHISQAFGTDITLINVPCATGPDPSQDPFQEPPAFEWTAEPESEQSDRYVKYLRELFPSPPSMDERARLTWVEGGSKLKDLLTVRDVYGRLHYEKVCGTTDVAIVRRVCLDMRFPCTGLCILFEVRKSLAELGATAVQQSACKVLLANIHSPRLQPVVVLTDLADNWQLYWLDGKQVRGGQCDSRTAAVGLINRLVADADVRSENENLRIDGKAVAASVDGIPECIRARKPLPDFGACATGTADVANLADLKDMMPEEERRVMTAQVMLQQLAALPMFSSMDVQSIMRSYMND